MGHRFARGARAVRPLLPRGALLARAHRGSRRDPAARRDADRNRRTARRRGRIRATCSRRRPAASSSPTSRTAAASPRRGGSRRSRRSPGGARPAQPPGPRQHGRLDRVRPRDPVVHHLRGRDRRRPLAEGCRARRPIRSTARGCMSRRATALGSASRSSSTSWRDIRFSPRCSSAPSTQTAASATGNRRSWTARSRWERGPSLVAELLVGTARHSLEPPLGLPLSASCGRPTTPPATAGGSSKPPPSRSRRTACGSCSAAWTSSASASPSSSALLDRVARGDGRRSGGDPPQLEPHAPLGIGGRGAES